MRAILVSNAIRRALSAGPYIGRVATTEIAARVAALRGAADHVKTAISGASSRFVLAQAVTSSVKQTAVAGRAFVRGVVTSAKAGLSTEVGRLRLRGSTTHAKQMASAQAGRLVVRGQSQTSTDPSWASTPPDKAFYDLQGNQTYDLTPYLDVNFNPAVHEVQHTGGVMIDGGSFDPATRILTFTDLNGGMQAARALTFTIVDKVTWSVSSLTIDIPVGSTSSVDLSPYLINYNPSLHTLNVTSGALPAGVTVDSANSELDVSGAQSLGDNQTVTLSIVDNADADFITRRTSQGVIRWFDFNSPTDLGGAFGANYGHQDLNGTIDIDTSVKASGASSLRFGIDASLGNNSNWWTNFSTDLSKLYGGNSEFYVQWKMRISQVVMEDWGHKYVIISTGDDGTNLYGSCRPIEIEMQTYATDHVPAPQNRFPTMYNACPGSCGASSVFTFQEHMGGGDFDLQNGLPTAACRYQDATKAGCIMSIPDQWMVFQIGVQVGPRIDSGGHSWFQGSRVRAWMQQSPGATEHLIFDWITGTTPGSAIGLCAGSNMAGNEKYGKVWLLPYTQSNVASPRAGYVWYDELIISEQKIPAALA